MKAVEKAGGVCVIPLGIIEKHGPRNGYTGIWWFARYHNHYASDVAEPNKRLGELLITSDANQLAELIKYLKSNNIIESLQEEFNKKADNPLQK